jgi:putative hydrolase of the HAD superfamily
VAGWVDGVTGTIEAVVFDLDGTLFDHRSSVNAALAEWVRQLSGVGSEKLTQAWLALEEQHIPIWLAGQVTFAEQRRRRLRDFLPLIGHPVGDDAALDAVFAGYLVSYQAAWGAFVDVHPTLVRLAHHGLRIAILTNGQREQQAAKLRAIGLASLVKAMLTAEDLGHAKPHPDTYVAACQLVSASPDRVMHVGDAYDLDVLAARAAGLNAVHLDRNDRGPHSEQGRIATLEALLPELDHPGNSC